jgi:hypothetical protein
MVRLELWRLPCCFIYSRKRRDKEPRTKFQEPKKHKYSNQKLECLRSGLDIRPDSYRDKIGIYLSRRLAGLYLVFWFFIELQTRLLTGLSVPL